MKQIIQADRGEFPTGVNMIKLITDSEITYLTLQNGEVITFPQASLPAGMELHFQYGDTMPVIVDVTSGYVEVDYNN